MTIEEIKVKKDELCVRIADQLYQFERETKCYVDGIEYITTYFDTALNSNVRGDGIVQIKVTI